MRKIFLGITILFLNYGFAQIANNHWQLGVSDINFTTNPPVASTIANSGNYGNASISDCNGNLLFYSDGAKVWNKNHQVMQNGGSIGNANSLIIYDNKQPCVIVPHPGNNNQYYVFNALIENNLCTGTCYSQYVEYKYCIVDFSDVAYPLGKVVQPQTSLHTYEHSNYGALTVVKNATNDGYFVVSGNGVIVKSYQVTNSGLNITPTDTFISNPVTYDPQNFNGEFLSNNSSVIKFSPDNSVMGQLVVTSKFHSGPNTSSSTSHFFTLNFNNSTGVFSNFTSVEQNSLVTGANVDFEFSSDSKKVYFVRDKIYVKNLLSISTPVRSLFETGTTSISGGFKYIQRDKYGDILISSISNTLNRNKYVHKIENQDLFATSSIQLNWLFLNNNTIGYMPQLVDKQCVSQCQTNLIINTPVTTSQDFRVSNLITASSAISNNLIVNYRANQIRLQPGFTVSGNTTGKFRAYVDPCNTTSTFAKGGEIDEKSNVLDNDKKDIISVFPNPNNGLFKISFNDLSTGSVEILDLFGRTVFKQEFKKENELEINLQEKPAGVYIVKASSNDEVFISKIVKN